jgi:hypothetical protein
MCTGWARSAEDILWRGTKLGLRFAPTEIENLQSAALIGATGYCLAVRDAGQGLILSGAIRLR